MRAKHLLTLAAGNTTGGALLSLAVSGRLPRSAPARAAV